MEVRAGERKSAEFESRKAKTAEVRAGEDKSMAVGTQEKGEAGAVDRPGRRTGRGARTTILRLLSQLAVNIYIYALVATVRTILYHDDGGIVAVLVYTCGAVMACLSSRLLADRPLRVAGKLSDTRLFRFIAYVLGTRQLYRAIAYIVSWLGIIVPAALPFIIFRDAHGLRPLFESAAACCAYIVSLKLARKAPARIIGSGGFFTGLIILVVCLELHLVTDAVDHLRPWLFGALHFLIFTYLVVRNQHDIDENIYNKKFVEKSLLPKDLRRVNAVSATFVFLLVLLLSNLKTVVARVLSLAGDLVSIIFNAILRIIEKIGPDAAEPESIEIPGDLLEQGMEQAPPSPYMNLFINIVQYFIVLYLAYKLVLLFISKIPSIVSALSGLLRRLFGVKTEEACDEESDFIDISEIVLPERAEKKRRRASKKKRRTARYLRRITDPAERIRYMYGLILDMLPQRGISPLPSDTTAEILAKAGETDGLPPFTAIYEQVRYGGMVPDQETLETAEQHYAKASDAIKDKSG